MTIVTLGVDLAKSVFQLHGVNKEGKVILKKRLQRDELAEFIAQLPPCLIGMEACGSSHYWARKFASFGHTVKLMSPQFVKPYVKSNKNDQNDAEAICEAVTRPTMRFVPIKEVKHQDLQALHRIRSLLVKNRTSLINQIRGLLAEYGVVLSKQAHNVREKLIESLSDENNDLSELSRTLFEELHKDLVSLDERIKECDHRMTLMFKTDENCQRLGTIPGVGVICATALTAAVSDPALFKNGRELAAWLGLVPRQSSSGNRQNLLGISKRGDRYLRTMLIHGARAVAFRMSKDETPKNRWFRGLKERRGMNKAIVALANKNARIAWSLLTKKEKYRHAV